ncbi:MAG TPA: HAD-IIIA family hydrolase [Saprospiraceae bacterium]|nr:HAD-IIIA family hydrolase [Candidatus Opimibacter skivensis]HQW01659.1 HAD-IIIA family hydrolase [Saprospiraceae bacterium]HQW25386.1 HAD-IIIA family hydrolase [Saprospiraceae bacterium]
MSDAALKKKAAQIKLLVLDVDGTLTDGGVYIDANGVQSKKFHIRDGMGITLLHEKGLPVGILSHSRSKTILDERARMLGIERVYSGKEPKLEVLTRWLLELNLTYEQVAYIGDDVNDLEVLEKVGFSACPHDAHFSLVKVVDVVLQRNGGQGCVREFIDRFLLVI